MRSAPRVFLLCLVISAATGCDCGKRSAKPAAGSAAPERDRPGTARATPDRKPPRDLRDLPKEARRTAPITLEEATAAMPTLEGARAMGATAVAPNGARALTSYCMDADSVQTAGESVVAQLQAAGWQRVTGRPPVPDEAQPQYGIAGEQGPLRVTASVMAVRRTGCDSTVNQFFTVIAIQKIGPAAPDVDGPDDDAGP